MLDATAKKRLREKLGERYDSEVERKIAKYYGLLTVDVAEFLLAREHGLATKRIVTLSQVKPWMRSVNTRGMVQKVFPSQEFERNGKMGKSVRIVLLDETGTKTVQLLDANASLADWELGTGDTIEIEGAYPRKEELVLGSKGKLNVLKKTRLNRLSELKDGFNTVSGLVAEINLDYPYLKEGKEALMRSFVLDDGRGYRRVVVWNEPESVHVEPGDEIRLESALFKNNELQIGSFSRVVMRKGEKKDVEGVIEGELQDIYCRELQRNLAGEGGKESLFVKIGEKEMEVPSGSELHVLGIRKLPQGVKLGTVVELKKQSLIGRKIKLRNKTVTKM
jgi:hypothetical protein